MGTRILLGAVLIACVVGLFGLDYWLVDNGGRPWGFIALAAFASTVCALEVSRIFNQGDARPFRIDLFLIGWGLLATVALAPPEHRIVHAGVAVAVGIMVLMLLAAAEHIWDRKPEEMARRLSATLMTFAYVFVPSAALVVVRQHGTEADPHLGLWLIIFTVATCRLGADSGAYFVGRAIGKHKLIPQVSPGKTIEGHLGGLACAVLIAWGCWAWMPGLQSAFSLVNALILGGGMWLFASSGDLVASALKRGAGIKDSGNLLPQFGGVLDLIDGFLLTGPLMYLVLLFSELWAK